jgi:hypothetical protein
MRLVLDIPVRSRLMGDLTGHVVVQSDSIAITVVDEGILK